jgi:hypothetical protein
VFTARRRFGPEDGDRWTRYVAWSGLTQLRELVSLDTILCPAVPEQLIAADWEHNVHADYETDHFRSLPYLLERTASVSGVNVLAVLRSPSVAGLAAAALPGFVFAGFDVLDVHGDVSVLTNCAGFDDVFAPTELSPLGLLNDLGRAEQVRSRVLAAHPDEPHARCDLWAIWRLPAGDALPATGAG